MVFYMCIRYDEEGFHKARAQPFKHESQVKIAVEGKRYMSPEKRDVFVRFPEGAARTPYLPRHTPSHAFPPPGSDIRRHGATDFIVSGSNVYNRNMPTPGKLDVIDTLDIAPHQNYLLAPIYCTVLCISWHSCILRGNGYWIISTNNWFSTCGSNGIWHQY